MEQEHPGFTIRRMRRRREWTLTELEERTSLSVAYLSAMETGRRPLTQPAAEQLADAFAETPEKRSEYLGEFKRLIDQHEACKKKDLAARKGAQTHKTLTAFERDIFDGLRLLRGGRTEKKPYELVEQEGFEIEDNGRTLKRRSIVRVDGELFEVEFSLARLEKDMVSDDFVVPSELL